VNVAERYTSIYKFHVKSFLIIAIIIARIRKLNPDIDSQIYTVLLGEDIELDYL